MNTIILLIIGLLWSGISGAIGWVVKGHVDAGQAVALAAHAETMRIERHEAGKLLAQLNREYAALQTQHRALIAHTDNLAARIADDDEAIPALRLQLAEALKPRKRTKGQPVKAEAAGEDGTR